MFSFRVCTGNSQNVVMIESEAVTKVEEPGVVQFRYSVSPYIILADVPIRDEV